MKQVRVMLSDEEYEFVKERPRAFLRTLVKSRMGVPEVTPPDPALVALVVPMIQLFQEGLIDKHEVRQTLGFEASLVVMDGGR